MPVMDGMELLAAIRDRYPALPVVIMTSKGSEETAVQALQNGASGYVPKRRMQQQLGDIVKSVLNANRHDRDHARVIECIRESRFTLELRNDRSQLSAVISYLQQAATQFGVCNERNRARLGIALEEALLNAVIHGNLEVCSELCDKDDGSFERLIQQRQTTQPYASRRVKVSCRLTPEEVRFQISDQGPGFDRSKLPDPFAPRNLTKSSGRGLLLMQSFMSSVSYNEFGNEITMTLSADSTESTAPPAPRQRDDIFLTV